MERLSGDHFHVADGARSIKVVKHGYSDAELKRILDERESAAGEVQVQLEAKQSLDRWIG